MDEKQQSCGIYKTSFAYIVLAIQYISYANFIGYADLIGFGKLCLRAAGTKLLMCTEQRRNEG